MPAMPRPNKKATKIAFSIIGTPPNMQHVKEDKSKRRRKRQLEYEDGRLLR
jgi:hypothetical protein